MCATEIYSNIIEAKYFRTMTHSVLDEIKRAIHTLCVCIFNAIQYQGKVCYVKHKKR